MKERREDSAITLNQRIVCIEHVEIRRAVVSVDDHFDAVANVVNVFVGGLVVPRVRIGRALSKRVDDPEQPAFGTDHHVRVVVEHLLQLRARNACVALGVEQRRIYLSAEQAALAIDLVNRE